MGTVAERLSAVRALMKERNLQAYIICTDDFHGYRVGRNLGGTAGGGRALD